MTGLILASSCAACAARHLFMSCVRKRPVGPITPRKRLIWRASSLVRRPSKKRQYHWNAPYGSRSEIQPELSHMPSEPPHLTPRVDRWPVDG